MVKKIIAFFLLVLFFDGQVFCLYGPQTLRIAIRQGVPSVSIKIKGNFEISDLDSNLLIYKGRSLKNKLAQGYQGKIGISDIKTDSARVKIRLVKNGLIYINNRPFREDINLIFKDNKLLVVNELNLEDYIKGVLSHEVSPWWPMEALKAQAVVARTYALYHLQFTKNKDFDLTADVYSQVYGGRTAERWRSNRAVDLTAGEILTYQENLLPAYYHATCAGHTEDAANLWNIDAAPLKGVACSFCVDSPHFRWKTQMPLEEMRVKLNNKGIEVSKITGLEIAGRNLSGRVTELRLICENKSLNTSAKDFRQALGPDIIRSTNFNINIISDTAYFEGLGWGHGVGLCQWGAYFMAKKNYKYQEILKYYYPGAELKTTGKL